MNVSEIISIGDKECFLQVRIKSLDFFLSLKNKINFIVKGSQLPAESIP